MKFRLKVVLCMVCLVSLLFGGGSCALISLSFQSALEREQTAARASYDLLLRTLQLVGQAEDWKRPQAVSRGLEQLAGQDTFTWSALCLSAGDSHLYQQGKAAQSFLALEVAPEQDAMTSFRHGGQHYLQLTGQVMTVAGQRLVLSAAYDITSIYQTRQQQLSAYGKIFAGLLVICAGLSYSAAWVLTRPLDKLSRTARALAAGDLTCRANIQTGDEIGQLAREFDAMAARQEAHVAALTATMEGQDRFIHSFTHELKTPMTSILGYADLLRRGTLSPEDQANAANYIFSEGKRLERLSLKLMDLFFVQRQEELPLVPVSPADLLRELTAPLEPALAEQNIRLIPSLEEGQCLLEPDLFRSLALNLLDNSRKALENGGEITLTCAMTEGGCVLSVRDNGRGIPPEALAHLTEAFYRVDKSRARAQGGAGLGLTLCDRIVKAHGGSLTIESAPGQGTLVTACLEGGRP